MLLGIDIGTTHTKAVVIDAAGREAAAATVATPFAARGERVEMEVDALLASVGDAIAALGKVRRRVVAVGLTGLVESGAPLDAGRRPLAPVIAWHDGRGTEAAARLEGAFGPDLALRIGQPVSSKLTAAKLGWLVAHGMEGMERWLGVPELVLHSLTGAEAIECSQATRTGCYDVAARRWMPEVAQALGFSAGAFAPVRPAGAAMGRVSAAAAGWTGLPAGAPVTVAGHDHLVGMTGAGAGAGAGQFGNSVGTAETVVARLPGRPDMARARELGLAVTLYPGGAGWAALASVVRAGVVLATAAGALGEPPGDLDRRAAAALEQPGAPAPIDLPRAKAAAHREQPGAPAPIDLPRAKAAAHRERPGAPAPIDLPRAKAAAHGEPPASLDRGAAAALEQPGAPAPIDLPRAKAAAHRERPGAPATIDLAPAKAAAHREQPGAPAPIDLARAAAAAHREQPGAPAPIDLARAAAAAVDGLARGDAAGMPGGDAGAVWAALLDALAARTAAACDRLTALAGAPAGMVVFGGGSVSEPWLQAKARRLPLPVRRAPAGSAAAARGAALWAGVAAGLWPSADAGA